MGPVSANPRAGVLAQHVVRNSSSIAVATWLPCDWQGSELRRPIQQAPGWQQSGGTGNFTYSYTFTSPGSYDYVCANHTFVMTGTIIVKPAGMAPLMHHAPAPCSCTLLVHNPRARSSCTVLVHRPHAPSSCTVLVHCPRPPPSCTVLVHCPRAPSLVHRPSAPSACTILVHHPHAPSLSACMWGQGSPDTCLAPLPAPLLANPEPPCEWNLLMQLSGSFLSH